jgi:hypothetical protein
MHLSKSCLLLLSLLPFSLQADPRVRVTSVAELIAAIRPGARILVASTGIFFSEHTSSDDPSPFVHYPHPGGFSVRGVTDLEIVGEGASAVPLTSPNFSGSVISFSNCKQLSLANLLIKHATPSEKPRLGPFSSDGVFSTGLSLGAIERLTVKNLKIGSGSVGLLMRGVQGSTVSGLEITNTWGTALLIDADPGAQPIRSRDLTFLDLNIHDNQLEGSPLFIRDSDHIRIARPAFIRNKPGKWVNYPVDNCLVTTAGSTKISIENPRSFDNGFPILRNDQLQRP